LIQQEKGKPNESRTATEARKPYPAQSRNAYAPRLCLFILYFPSLGIVENGQKENKRVMEARQEERKGKEKPSAVRMGDMVH